MHRPDCERHENLSVFDLREYGYFEPVAKSGGIRWSQGLEAKVSVDANNGHARFRHGPQNYPVKLTSTPCFFGGQRYWFICPLVIRGRPCKRRCAVLYLVGEYFGCRECYGLAYRSQRLPRSGLVGAFEGFCTYDRVLHIIESLRIKYWHGRPTKRYRRLLQRQQRLAPNFRNLNHFEN